jgi:hypothetical protein
VTGIRRAEDDLVLVVSAMATSPGILAEETEDALGRVLDVTSEETPVFGRL